MLTLSGRFAELNDSLTSFFLAAPEAYRVDVGEWQSMDVTGRPEMVTWELPDVILKYEGDGTDIPANQPWADQHFEERVGGMPVNPPPSHSNWPHAQQDNGKFTADDGTFSHTYPERMWPRFASAHGHLALGVDRAWDDMVNAWKSQFGKDAGNLGIRFRYGDLQDVVDLLVRVPHTRQAFLPIWFPEDTGAHHGERVPCSLGYQFLLRFGKLSCTYFIRSCDFRRHFADDLYFADRLMQWVANQVSEKLQEARGLRVVPDRVIMHITSLHIFEGDRAIMEQEYQARVQEKIDARAERLLKGLG